MVVNTAEVGQRRVFLPRTSTADDSAANFTDLLSRQLDEKERKAFGRIFEVSFTEDTFPPAAQVRNKVLGETPVVDNLFRQRTVADPDTYVLTIKPAEAPDGCPVTQLANMFYDGRQEIQQVNQEHPEAIYPLAILKPDPLELMFFLRKEPYPEVEAMRKSLANYQYENHYPCLDEMVYCLRQLGLTYTNGSICTVFNPASRLEVIVYDHVMASFPSYGVIEGAYRVGKIWQEGFKEQNFIAVVHYPPLEESLLEGDWYKFFPLIHFKEQQGEYNIPGPDFPSSLQKAWDLHRRLRFSSCNFSRYN